MIYIIGTISLVIMGAGGYWHIRKTLEGDIMPPPAAFVSFVLGMSVSYWLYWQAPEATIWGNPGQLGATVEIALMTAAVFYARYRKGDLWAQLTAGVDQMMVGGFAIVLVICWWFIIRFSGFDEATVTRVSFVTSQMLMVGGYFGTVSRFLKMKENHDSLFAWSCIFFSSIFALYPAWVRADALSMINAVRATALSAFTLAFLTGLDAANGRFIKKQKEAVNPSAVGVPV